MEISAHKRFKKLMEEWVDIAIEASKLRMKIYKIAHVE